MSDILADIFVLVFEILLYGTGTLLRWIAKGCNGSLIEAFNEGHDLLDAFLSVLFWAAVFAIFFYFNNKP